LSTLARPDPEHCQHCMRGEDFEIRHGRQAAAALLGAARSTSMREMDTKKHSLTDTHAHAYKIQDASSLCHYWFALSWLCVCLFVGARACIRYLILRVLVLSDDLLSICSSRPAEGTQGLRAFYHSVFLASPRQLV
jgi:hypothetical protein